MLSVCIAVAAALPDSASGQAPDVARPEKALRAELAEAHNPVHAYLAVGEFDEGRRVPLGDSPTRYDTPYGPILIRGMATHAVKGAKDWIARMLRKEVIPPPGAEFKAYQKSADAGCDTFTVAYEVGQTQIRISQTVWLFAIAVKGPGTAVDLAQTDLAALANNVQGVARGLLNLKDETTFRQAERHAACVTADRVPARAIGPSENPRKTRHPTAEEVRAHLARVAGDPACPPTWELMGWWADGQRFGYVGRKHPGGRRASIVGTDANANRVWFKRPRSKSRMQRMAAEFRASGASKEQK